MYANAHPNAIMVNLILQYCGPYCSITGQMFKRSIQMKKSNFGYMVMWYGGGVALATLSIILGIVLSQIAFMAIGFLLLICTPIFVRGILRKRMEKSVLVLESRFAQSGFTYQHKFISNNGVLYVDQNGRIGVVWRNNPTQFQFMDLTKVTEVYTSKEQQGGTVLVSCQFKLGRETHKIFIRCVSKNNLSMKDPRVIEVIEKVENLSAMLRGVDNRYRDSAPLTKEADIL